MNAAEIVRIVRVVDTRDYVEVGDRFVPVPGSGQTRQCDRCGRDHEVHAEVELSGGGTAVVGASCAKGSSVAKEIGRRIDRAKALRQLEVRREVIAGNLKRLEEVRKEVEALPKPPLVWTMVGGDLAAQIGDSVARKYNAWQTDADLELNARGAWFQAQVNARYGCKVRGHEVFALRNELSQVDDKIAKLTR